MMPSVMDESREEIRSYGFPVPCHGRGRGFEPRRPRHTFQKTYGTYGPK